MVDDFPNRQVGPDVDKRKVATHLVGGCSTVRRITESQISSRVVSPALNAAIGKPGAGRIACLAKLKGREDSATGEALSCHIGATGA